VLGAFLGKGGSIPGLVFIRGLSAKKEKTNDPAGVMSTSEMLTTRCTIAPYLSLVWQCKLVSIAEGYENGNRRRHTGLVARERLYASFFTLRIINIKYYVACGEPS